MYHQHLERQIKKYLGDSGSTDERFQDFLKAVSNSYINYERDRELSDHAFSINEIEYHSINKKLQELTADLENKIKERTKELEDIAQFPLENPNPIFRVDLEGKILFSNSLASAITTVVYEGKNYDIKSFFKEILRYLNNAGNIDIVCNDTQYIFYYKNIEGKNYINFYGADVTEKNILRLQAQENFQRLRNFLESTEAAYYIIYSSHKEKNFITSKWSYFFGFDLLDSKDLFLEKSETVLSESQKVHYDKIKKLSIGDKLSIEYQVKNKISGESFWLSEVISKQYDIELDDIVVSGRITDITKEHTLSMQIKESEERFRTLIDVVPVMVWVSNEKNIVTYSNQASKKFLGYELEKLKNNRQYVSFVHPDDRKHAITQWNKNIAKKKPILSEYRLKDAQGNYHNILEKAAPRFYADGNFAGYIGAYFDLTSEKSFQQTLKVEKDKLELLTRNSPDIILLTNHHGIIEYVSPTAKRILGYRDEEMIQNSISKFICKECKNQLESISWLKNIRKNDSKFEYRMMDNEGKLIWVESVMSIIKNKDNSEYKILMHNRDITAIKNAEDILRESEQKYRGLFENMQLGILEVDLEDKVKWANRSFEKLSGYSLKYLKGKKAFDLFLPDNITKKIMTNVSKTRAEKNESIYEIKMKKNKGELVDVVISGSPIIDMQGKVRGSIGIHWDVTEIRKMERKMEEDRLSRQKEIMQATLNAEEKQREILGNELHDGVGHILTYTNLFLQMAANSDTFQPDLFSKAQDKVGEALNEVRRISRNLVPPALIDLGLKEAIIELFNQYSEVRKISYKIDCKAKDFTDLDFNAQRNIYRIIQELISNTIKHAEASEVNLSFKRTATNLTMNYFNDGNMFNPEKVKKGLGLKSINNRAYFYGGSADIKSVLNKGSQFIIELPLKNIINLNTGNKVESIN